MRVPLAALDMEDVGFAQSVERGPEGPEILVRSQEPTLIDAPVVQWNENAALPWRRPRVRVPPDALELCGSDNSAAECQSSKLERWVRIPLTAFWWGKPHPTKTTP